MMYPPKYEMFATGGTIGDALFMFCSGYTLFLGRIDRFDNWYKRRINRIYPSVFAWAIFSFYCFADDMNIGQIVGGASRWFIPCIMMYYVLLYFVRKYLMRFKWWVFVVACIIPIVRFVMYEDIGSYHMYRNHTFRFFYWFPFMLMGAYIGSKNVILKQKVWRDAIMTLVCTGLHLGLVLACTKKENLCPYQMLSLVPLMGTCIYLYNLFQADIFKLLMKSNVGYGIQAIAALCLESYIVQYVLFTDKINYLFPLNIIILVVEVILLAYAVRTLGRTFKQLFEKEDFRWKEIFRLV